MFPKFSILIPTTGRPTVVREALISVLQQDFDDYEVIVSNNGAHPDTKNSLSDLLANQRIRYVEHHDLLAMPYHWEKISLMAKGQNHIFLTDRSLFYKGALRKISDCVDEAEGAPISWGWSNYDNSTGMLTRNMRNRSGVIQINSRQLFEDTFYSRGKYPFALPRGLNSCVSRSILDRIRSVRGTVYNTLNPDFSSAYACLFCSEVLFHFDDDIFVSQAPNLSNGGNNYVGDSSKYVNELSLDNPYRNSPLKIHFVENSIVEDWLDAILTFGGAEMFANVRRGRIYELMFDELAVKRNHGVLSSEVLDEFEEHILDTLAQEDKITRDSVELYSKNADSVGSDYMSIFRSIVAARLKKVRLARTAVSYFRGGRRFSSALAAAGFDL